MDPAAAELIARFDAAVPDMWEPHPAPTPESVARIEAQFGCRLPPLLVDFARHSRSFSSFFLGLGPDYDEYTNILGRNHFIRTDPDWLRAGPGAPDHLLMFSDNFMHDYFWCLDTRAGTGFEVVYWSQDGDEAPPHATFEDFIRAQVEYYEAKKRRR